MLRKPQGTKLKSFYKFVGEIIDTLYYYNTIPGTPDSKSSVISHNNSGKIAGADL
jgi:hypothetical protein